MAEKGRSRGPSSRSKPRAQSRPPRSSSPQPSPSPEPPEPLDVEPLLAELLQRVLSEVAQAAVARQRVPFAVARARDAILFVAEWRFLVRDDKVPEPQGDPEPERDGAWKEDEEPPAGIWDSWTPGVVAVAEASPPSGEELSEADEAPSPPAAPGEVPGAAPAVDFPRPRGQFPSGARPVTAKGPLGVPLSPSQSRSAAAAAPVQPPGPRPPPRPKPPGAPQPRERGRRLSRSPQRSRPPSRAPGRRRQPPRPPQPRAAPPEAPPVPPPAAPPEPAAPAAPEPREQEAPPPPPSSSSRSSAGSVHPRRPSRSPGVPRLGARRGAARWVLPEVKVLDVSTEAERPRLGAPRTRLPLPGSHVQVIPGTARAARAEPQLCDPWLASVRLAPGVTVRWGRCERRGPALAGHGGDEQGDEALRRAEKDLKPILPYPECRLSEYGEAEEWQNSPLETEQFPGLPVPGPALGGSMSPRVSPVQWLEQAVVSGDPPGDRASFTQK